MGFLEERHPFIAVDSRNVTVYLGKDGRTCKEWAMEDLKLTEEQWANAVRGYLMEGRLQFFSGEDYRCAMNITPRILEQLCDIYEGLYGSKPTEYFNGCQVGKEGEVWRPLRHVDIGDWG